MAARLGGRLDRGLALENAEDVALLHDEEILAIDLDLGAGPLAEQHPVTWLHVERDDLAGLIACTGTDGDDLALLRLFLRGVGNDDATLGLGVLLDALHHDTIMQWTELHGSNLMILSVSSSRYCAYAAGWAALWADV